MFFSSLNGDWQSFMHFPHQLSHALLPCAVSRTLGTSQFPYLMFPHSSNEMEVLLIFHCAPCPTALISVAMSEDHGVLSEES